MQFKINLQISSRIDSLSPVRQSRKLDYNLQAENKEVNTYVENITTYIIKNIHRGYVYLDYTHYI